MSWSDGADDPTTTILPRNAEAGSVRLMRFTNETVVIVPGGPRKSIHASPPSGGSSWRPSADSAAATAKVSSLSTSNGTFRITPPVSGGSAAFAARALYSRRTSSPPKTFVPPFSSTSVVASTTYPARPTASIRAASSRCRGSFRSFGSPLGSVNWTS